jgi:iron(III) transport system permease protein
MQLDKTLDECGQVCGANWRQRIRTVNIPLLQPGIVAAWMLLFIGSVRELGASILLVGPNSQVLTPAIVDAWNNSSSELTSAMALIQTVVVGVAIGILMVLARRRELRGG